MSREKVISLLGKGLPPVVVANATGISESRVSQIAAEPEAAAEIAELRFANLQVYSDLDDGYNRLEKKLLTKLEDSLCFIQRPGEIVKSLQIVNAAKRRGAESPTNGAIHQQVVTVVLPTQVVRTFTTDAANQVVQAGEQTLLTIQSSNVAKLLPTPELKQGVTQNDLNRTTRPRPGSNAALAVINAEDL